jgi:hypothetical protein
MLVLAKEEGTITGNASDGIDVTCIIALALLADVDDEVQVVNRCKSFSDTGVTRIAGGRNTSSPFTPSSLRMDDECECSNKLEELSLRFLFANGE